MSPTKKETTVAITHLIVVVDFAGRRYIEKRVVSQARDRRGGESCRRICCRLAVVTIVESRGGRDRSLEKEPLSEETVTAMHGGQLPGDAFFRPEQKMVPLPPDASSALYVEDLLSDSNRKEVAHFANPACAATAMNAL
ncbi:hypothetical protein AHAS_Ahas05G0284900 [Arachis hypogaea]